MWSLYKERHNRVMYFVMLALTKWLAVRVSASMKWRVDSWHGVAVSDGAKPKTIVDLSLPTDRQLCDRQPDIVLHLKENKNRDSGKGSSAGAVGSRTGISEIW